MLSFSFELRPLAEVAPWGSARPNLHWFGLTDGWYWIDVEGHELPRYRDEAVHRWNLERPYPDYYLARFWEDLLVLRWALQVAVPDDLVPFVDGTFPPREFPDDAISAEVEVAFNLQGDHHLDFGYLTDAPTVSCYRHSVGGEDVVALSQLIPPGKQGTFEGPERLDVAVPANEFFAAVADVDRRLIAAMGERVTALERSGPPSGIELDLAQLRTEHLGRSRWLAHRLASPRHVDWARVRAGVAEISTWPVEPE
ncbi:hypothetical protein D7147_03910 [Micromonospora musae]|uniref:Uncharacterized protein n=1 Tax=Micromonospora musae TaxID=1894970 RepID=A0A3A9YAC9_9ACTN|nr:DUF5984 family protein [Micromonospora musae]RKN24144.1 hypothetical protein D7147_03910 [Micromonospora musae]RKN28637.1 hypothetical protein D7044_25800 [Micromonospora musae]